MQFVGDLILQDQIKAVQPIEQTKQMVMQDVHRNR